ncbi:hypothetical protein EDD11_007612 [Mortierella claussenii]|nr:hypothetical protein EDD11_007612 [Mortierella claussenii]
MTCKGYTFSYYVSGHGFGHATRVNQIITELLKSTTSDKNEPTTTATTTATTGLLDSTLSCSLVDAHPASSSRHTIYIVSDAPEFIFQDVIALGAIYRSAKVDAGVVQPLAYSVDREQTIEGCKQFLSRRDEMIQSEVSWLAQVGVDCVLADAPFLPCAAASAYGIPAILITNFTFDEVYRFLREGDDLDKDVIACADAALEDYKKASLLLRLPGSIDIPAFGDEILTMELKETIVERVELLISSNSDNNSDDQEYSIQLERKDIQETTMGDTTPTGVMSPVSVGTAVSSPSMSIMTSSSSSSLSSSGRHDTPLFNDGNCRKMSRKSSRYGSESSASSSRLRWLRRKAVDVPLVVRMAVNSREDVLRSLGVDEETMATHKMALVSFGGQRLTEGWGNPLPPGWIGVICGLPVEHELPPGFYRSPHGVYVPDLTEAADIVIGKLKPLIYVSRPQFIEEHGLIRMMKNHGLPVEMTAEEFETGHWQRAILEADRQSEEEKEGRRLFEDSCSSGENSCGDDDDLEVDVQSVGKKQIRDAEESLRRMMTTMEENASSVATVQKRGTPTRRSRRSSSVGSIAEMFRPKGSKMARLSPVDDNGDEEDAEETNSTQVADVPKKAWFERRIPNNGGEVCAKLVEQFMAQLEEYERE